MLAVFLLHSRGYCQDGVTRLSWARHTLSNKCASQAASPEGMKGCKRAQENTMIQAQKAGKDPDECVINIFMIDNTIIKRETNMKCHQCGNNIVTRSDDYRGNHLSVTGARLTLVSGAHYVSDRRGRFFLSGCLISIPLFIGWIFLTAFLPIFLPASLQGVYALIYGDHANVVLFVLWLFVPSIVLAILLTSILFKALHIKVNWSLTTFIKCDRCGSKFAL